MEMQPNKRQRLLKLVDRLIDPSTSENERESARKEAYAICQEANVMASDAFTSDDNEPRIELASAIVSLADLRISLDEVQKQLRREKKTSKDLRAKLAAALDVARCREAQLQAEIIEQREARERLRTENAKLCEQIVRLEEQFQERELASERATAPLQAEVTSLRAKVAALQTGVASLNKILVRQDTVAASTIVEEPVEPEVEQPIVRSKPFAGLRRAAAKRTAADGVKRSARMTTAELDEAVVDPISDEKPHPDKPHDTPRWSCDLEVRFNVLAALGRARSSIARTLSREFGRKITTACVLAMMVQRWLSPGYGLA